MKPIIITITAIIAIIFSVFFIINRFISSSDSFSSVPSENQIFSDPQSVDTTLHASSGKYIYQNKNSVSHTYFSKNPTSKDSIKFVNRQAAIAFFTDPGQSFGQAQHSTPIVSANTLTYPQIFPETDIRYTNNITQLLEEFIVHSPSTAIKMTTITQTVNLTDIDRYEEIDHGLSFFRQNQVVARVPRPVMYELNNRNRQSYGISYTVKAHTSTNLTVSKNINQEGLDWLQDPERNYPIVIDLAIDNADTIENWASSNATYLPISTEATIVQEGTGSLKLAASAPFGSSSDGACTISSNLNLNTGSCVGRAQPDAVNFESNVNTNVGSSSIILSTGATGISAGDEVLIIDMVSGNGSTASVGKYEFITVSTVGGTLLTFGTTLANTYPGGTDAIVVQRVPQYSTVAINSGITLTANTWNSSTGGIVAFKASIGVTNNGVITTSSLGYTSGSAGGTSASQGQSRPGSGSASTAANDGGGGGGAGDGSVAIGSGGGGGYGSAGIGGTNVSGGTGGTGGKSHGSSTLSILLLGSGGGGGSTSDFGSPPCSVGGAPGASGGGAIYIGTQRLANNGSILANGASTSNNKTGGGGGSGSGGSIFISSIGVTMGTTAATGGTSSSMYCAGPAGGDGGSGRIRVEADSIQGSSTPAASTAAATGSLNETATLTTTSPKDLSTASAITFWVRSNHTGQYITFQFGETVSTENTFPVTINSVDTWEQKSVDISSISPTARDAATKFAFKVSAVSTIYVDDIQTNSSPNSPTLLLPVNNGTTQSFTPTFKTVTTDPESEDVQYKINLCTDSAMSVGCSIFSQVTSQTGWSGQNVGTSAYSSGTTATYILPIGSSLASATVYYWNSAAIDPSGSNVFGNTSPTWSFTTDAPPSPPLACIIDQTNYPSSYTVRWADNSGNEDGFEVYRQLDTDTPILQNAAGGAITTISDSYTDTSKIDTGASTNYSVSSGQLGIGTTTGGCWGTGGSCNASCTVSGNPSSATDFYLTYIDSSSCSTYMSGLFYPYACSGVGTGSCYTPGSTHAYCACDPQGGSCNTTDTIIDTGTPCTWIPAYYTLATIQSTNLLTGSTNVDAVSSFNYSLSSAPSGTTASIKFSQNASTWYNSSGTIGGTNTLTVGTTIPINLINLGWSGPNFYYLMTLSSGGSSTPVVNDVTTTYTTGAVLQTTGAGVTGFVDTDIQPSHSYNYRIRSKRTATGGYIATSAFCSTTTVNVGVGTFQLGGLKLQGIKVQ